MTVINPVPTPPLTVVFAAAEGRIARDARCRIQRPRTAAEFDRAGALYRSPRHPSRRRQVQRSALDVHGSGVVERVQIVEVAALPLLVNVPGLFTTARRTGVAAARGAGDDRQSAARGLVVERRSAHDRQSAGTGSLAGIRVGAVQIDLDILPVAVLVPPSCSVRPPSSAKPVG